MVHHYFRHWNSKAFQMISGTIIHIFKDLLEHHHCGHYCNATALTKNVRLAQSVRCSHYCCFMHFHVFPNSKTTNMKLGLFRNFPGLKACSRIVQIPEKCHCWIQELWTTFNVSRMMGMRKVKNKNKNWLWPMLSLEQGDEESFDRLTGGSSFICFSLWSITQCQQRWYFRTADFKLEHSNTTKQHMGIYKLYL